MRREGRFWCEQRFLIKIGPVALYGWLFTIVMLIAIQGDAITSSPRTSCASRSRCLSTSWPCSGGLRDRARAAARLPRTASLSFTAASNNFELAVAVAIGVFGATSGQALAGAWAPLLEVPVLVGLLHGVLVAGPPLFGSGQVLPNPIVAVRPAESVD